MLLRPEIDAVVIFAFRLISSLPYFFCRFFAMGIQQGRFLSLASFDWPGAPPLRYADTPD